MRRAAPTVYGFRITGSYPTQFHRSGGGTSPLEIRTLAYPSPVPQGPPLAEWYLPGTGGEEGPHASLHQDGTAYRYSVSDAGVYHVDPAHARIECPDGADPVREHRLWSVPTTLCYTHRGEVPLHAAAVDVDGRAVLLAAPGHHGKTTLALGFHRHGYRVLTEDMACCSVAPSFAVWPGPALLRIRPDVFDGDAPDDTRVVLKRPDRVYLSIDEARRGSGARVPLAGLFLLRQGSDRVRFERLAPVAALADLWALNFHFRTDDHRAQSFKKLTRLLTALPCWNLFRPLKMDRLDEAVAGIVETLEAAGI